MPRAELSLGTIVAGTKILSAYIFQRSGGATQLIVHLDDGSLRYSTNFLTAAGGGDPATWTSIATGLSTTAPFTYATFIDKVWMTNGTNDFRSWDGAASATFASAPKGLFLAVWRDTVWMGNGGTAAAHRIYQCSPGDPTVWPALTFVDVEKGVGFGISGIYAVESALIVFKAYRTHIIFDPVEYTNRVIDQSKGCLSHYSIVAHNGVVYFVSHLGICRFLGDGPSQIISEKISPFFDDLFTFGTSLATQVMDLSKETHICGYSFENFVGWYLPTNVSTTHVKFFPDLPDQPWIFGQPQQSASTNRQFTLAVRELGKYQHLYNISGSPAVLNRQYGNTATTTVTCEWGSAWFDFDSPLEEKYISMIQVLHRGQITVEIRKDYDQTFIANVATALDHGDTELRESTIYTDFYARAIQLVVYSVAGAERQSVLGTGAGALALVSRFSAAVSKVEVSAKVLGQFRR